MVALKGKQNDELFFLIIFPKDPNVLNKGFPVYIV